MLTAEAAESTVNEDGKNKCKIFCTFCPSKILNPGTARLTNTESANSVISKRYHSSNDLAPMFPLPYMHSKAKGEDVDKELVNEFWLVDDVYTFENIGVSQTAENVKYLVCADCERGPVGWHDLSTKKSYIALSRVKHE